VLTTRGHKALFEALRDLAPTWLALGGGGYDISVVPRSWTLALATMAGHHFPDALPPGYRRKYGGDLLADEEEVVLPEETETKMRKQVELVVAGVKQVHGL